MFDDARKILLINCSAPNYNLAIEKAKIYFGVRAEVIADLQNLFVPDYDGLFLSVIFSWDIPFALSQAKIALREGKKVMIGGGTQQAHAYIEKELGIRPHFAVNDELEKVVGQFKMVYFTRGCSKKCWFCTVPRIEGDEYVLNYNSRPALVLMDNNLAHAPVHMREYIIEKYLSAGIKTVDINSGFEPTGIDERVVKLFDQLPLRWWRMGFDVIEEEQDFIAAVKVIQAHSKKKIRAYTMIGHEPFEQCWYRCRKVIELGCEPVPQAYIRLNAMKKEPEILHDWTLERLKWFQRFYYMPGLWRKLKLEEYMPVKNRLPFAS